MKTTLFILTMVLLMSCGGSGGSNVADSSSKQGIEQPKASPKGIGEIKNVTLSDPLDEGMIKSGKAIYEMKCAACHRLTAQRVVGPGFEGVTNRRRPEWIMNMITNVDVMLDKDPQAQALLEECLTRMPNQNVSVGDARGLLEFMRQNDEQRISKRDGAIN